MKKIAFLIVIVIVAFVLITSFSSNEDIKVEHLIYSYQDTYVGDNTSVGGILYDIFLSENVESFALGTSKAPYSITVNYVLDQEVIMEELSQNMEYNATTLFAFVKNVDLVTFNVEGTVQKIYVFKRETIQRKYNDELSSYVTDENTWMKEVYSTIIER